MKKRLLMVLAALAGVGCSTQPAMEEAATSVEQATIPQTVQLASFKYGEWWIDTNNNRVKDAGDTFATFGKVGDIPLLGRWSFNLQCQSTGVQQVGVYRPDTGEFILDKNGNLVQEANEVFKFITPSTNWERRPVVFKSQREFAGCRSVVGLVTLPTTSNPQFFADPPLAPIWKVDSNGNDKFDSDSIEIPFAFGVRTDTFTTILNGSRSVAAVKRTEGDNQAWWYIDYNRNHAWDGCDIDQCGQFGAGDWRALTNAESPHIGVNDGATSFIDTNNNRFWDGDVVDGMLAHPVEFGEVPLYIARFP